MSGIVIKTLGEWGFTVIDGDRGRHYPKQDEFFATGHCLFLNAGNVTRIGFNFKVLMFVDESKDALMNKGKLQRGDIVITTRGTIGNTAHYDETIPYDHIRINSGMAIIRSTSDAMTPDFLIKYLNSAYFKKEIERLSFGSAQPQLTISILNKLRVPGPESKEQKRVVKVLDTWDEYLEKINIKIERKKHVKKGLMQRLLTGALRVPGYTDEWLKLTLEEIGDIRTSSVDKLSLDSQLQVGLLNYMDVYKRDHIKSTDKFQRVTAKQQQITSSNLKAGDILFTPSSETQTDIGHSAVVVEDLENVLYSYHLIRLRPENKLLHYRFSAYAFKTREFYIELWKRSQGATRYTLSKEALQQSVINIPRSLDEQLAIARILEVADEDIRLLENKMNAVAEQKKYLVNNLLSGKLLTTNIDNDPAKEIQYA